jgi:hypothetical protein
VSRFVPATSWHPIALPAIRGADSFSAAAPLHATLVSRGDMATYRYAKIPAQGERIGYSGGVLIRSVPA